jgi:hypothetical protein
VSSGFSNVARETGGSANKNKRQDTLLDDCMQKEKC